MSKLLMIIFTLCSLSVFGQSGNFNGKIIYEYQFLHSATGEDMRKSLGSFFGREQHYYANSENYKAYDENGQFRQLYNSKTNTYYFLNPGNGLVMEMDAGNQTSKVISVEHFEETQQILGKECNKLIIKTDSDETTYWYSTEIKLNPENFKEHNVGNWNRYMEESGGALPLKFTVKNQNYIWVSAAIEIEDGDLKNEDFNITDEIEGN